jgi:hypothetical protein
VGSLWTLESAQVGFVHARDDVLAMVCWASNGRTGCYNRCSRAAAFLSRVHLLLTILATASRLTPNMNESLSYEYFDGSSRCCIIALPRGISSPRHVTSCNVTHVNAQQQQQFTSVQLGLPPVPRSVSSAPKGIDEQLCSGKRRAASVVVDRRGLTSTRMRSISARLTYHVRIVQRPRSMCRLYKSVASPVRREREREHVR